MDCNTCKKYIHAYLDGCLPRGMEEEIFSHIATCPACERYYEDMIEIYDRLGEPEIEVPPGFSYSWRGAVEQAAEKKRKVNYKALIPALAACVCGVFVMSVVLFNPGRFQTPSTTSGGESVSSEQHTIEGQDNGPKSALEVRPQDQSDQMYEDQAGQEDPAYAESGGGEQISNQEAPPDVSVGDDPYGMDVGGENPAAPVVVPGEEQLMPGSVDEGQLQGQAPIIGKANIVIVDAKNKVTKQEFLNYVHTAYPETDLNKPPNEENTTNLTGEDEGLDDPGFVPEVGEAASSSPVIPAVVLTDMETSVLIQANEGILNSILEAFQLEKVSGTETIEILF